MVTSLHASSLWFREAWEAAKLRRDDHSRCGNDNGRFGDPKDYYPEFFGSLAQVVFREHARQWDHLVCEFAPLYVPNERLHELPPWDARINGWEVEIKGIPPDTYEEGRYIHRRKLLVKKSEMHDSQIFVGVKFFNYYEYEIAGYAWREEVLRARIFSKYEDAYSIPMDQLHVLSAKVFEADRKGEDDVNRA